MGVGIYGPLHEQGPEVILVVGVRNLNMQWKSFWLFEQFNHRDEVRYFSFFSRTMSWLEWGATCSNGSSRSG